jgi:hypothetical protein
LKEAQFISSLFPASTDYLPIIQYISEKYNIPEISSEDDEINIK